MSVCSPLRLRPWLRPMPWGGTSLTKLLGLPETDQLIGEAWLVCDHALHASVVIDGPHQGQSLRELAKEYCQELVGRPAERFPLLVKVLDARQNLSIQVHPDDELAARWAPKEGGKTEAWHVLDSAPEGTIYLGLKPGVDLKTFQRELTTGNAALCLQRYQAKAGETYYVPAGTVHALGEGVIVLEVQQTSDATFRLDDWGRVDAGGKARELHWEAGLACIKERSEGAGRIEPVLEPDGSWRLVESSFFKLRKWQGSHRVRIQGPAVLILWEGAGRIDGFDLHRGEAMLAPRSLVGMELQLEADAILFTITW